MHMHLIINILDTRLCHIVCEKNKADKYNIYDIIKCYNLIINVLLRWNKPNKMHTHRRLDT